VAEYTLRTHDLFALRLLVLNTGGGAAEDALVQDGQETAAGTLSDFGADGAEVVARGGHLGRVGAVEVREAEDVSRAALRSPVEAGAGDVDGLALLDNRGREGDAGEEGGDGDGELHLDGRLCF